MKNFGFRRDSFGAVNGSLDMIALYFDTYNADGSINFKAKNFMETHYVPGTNIPLIQSKLPMLPPNEYAIEPVLSYTGNKNMTALPPDSTRYITSQYQYDNLMGQYNFLNAEIGYTISLYGNHWFDNVNDVKSESIHWTHLGIELNNSIHNNTFNYQRNYNLRATIINYGNPKIILGYDANAMNEPKYAELHNQLYYDVKGVGVDTNHVLYSASKDFKDRYNYVINDMKNGITVYNDVNGSNLEGIFKIPFTNANESLIYWIMMYKGIFQLLSDDEIAQLLNLGLVERCSPNYFEHLELFQRFYSLNPEQLHKDAIKGGYESEFIAYEATEKAKAGKFEADVVNNLNQCLYYTTETNRDEMLKNIATQKQKKDANVQMWSEVEKRYKEMTAPPATEEPESETTESDATTEEN